MFFHHVVARRREEFVRAGGKQRDFFPHRLVYLPKCGPDGFRLARRMCGPIHLDTLWEVVLYADPELLREFPRELFFDPDLIWHQQHFGRAGQVATANLARRGDRLLSMVHISDLVQRRRDSRGRG